MEYSASQFASRNCIPTKNGRKCTSGRYSSNDATSGMIARPGADFGYIMAMLGYNHEQKLGLSVEECVQRIYTAIIQLDNTFYMHTDSTEDPNIPYSIGCRHVYKATDKENADRYGFKAEDLQQAITLLKTSENYPVTMISLDGAHKEKGVFIINDTEHTVNSQDDDHMYFVYDKKRDDLFLKELVQELGMKNVIYEDFQRVSTMQLSIALQLSAKDLPIFEVNFTDPVHPTIKHLGTV